MSDTGVKEMLRNFYEEFLMVTMKPRPSNMCGRTTGSTTREWGRGERLSWKPLPGNSGRNRNFI